MSQFPRRFPRRGRILAATLAASSLALGCGISEPSNNAVDTFTGTVELGGFVYQAFTVGRDGGEVSIKITSIVPDSGATLGMLYGQIGVGSATNCNPIVQTLATQGVTAIANRIAKGDYCLVIYDAGSNYIVRAETYTVDVSHP